MALSGEFKELLTQIDQQTTLVGEMIGTLAARIKNNMTDAEVEDLKNHMTAIKGRLVDLAKDPTNPVPVESAKFSLARTTTGK